MIKKGFVVFLMLVLSLSFVSAVNKIELSISDESVGVGDNVEIVVSLLDSENKQIDGEVSILIEDGLGLRKIERIVMVNELVSIDLGANASSGSWSAVASYTDESGTVKSGKEFFFVEINEEAKFEIDGDELSIINVGNVEYSRNVEIIIGDTIGKRNVRLNPGESLKFRLIAPNGNYNIRVTDGDASLTRSNVALTGRAVGILDERLDVGGSALTGGVKPDEDTDASDLLYDAVKSKAFVYVFVLVVIGAAILLAIERRVKRK
jgi:hypothetical protein